MGAFLMFLLLFVKHYVCSSIIDVGYSESRYQSSPHPWLAWKNYLLTELAGTLLLLRTMNLPLLFATMGGEVVLMGIGCVLERVASVRISLRIHVYSEVALLTLYGGICTIRYLTS